MRHALGVFLLFVMGSAQAEMVEWLVSGTLDDGGTLSGSIYLDGVSVSNVDLVTTDGSSMSGDTFERDNGGVVYDSFRCGRQACAPGDPNYGLPLGTAGHTARMQIDDFHMDWLSLGIETFNLLGFWETSESASRSLISGEMVLASSVELPLTTQELITALINDVIALNLQKGISNALDAKLDSALRALEDTNENNDVAALNSMYAVCNSVEAQRGQKITDADADIIIASINGIIPQLDESAPICQ